MTQSVIKDETKNDWIGEVLNKKYIVIKKLGRGSYASVWMAVNKDTKKPYAIKINNTYDMCEGKTEVLLLERFRNLEIPNIVEIIEYFVCDPIGNYASKTLMKKHVCIVMELMACSLYDLMKHNYSDGLPIKYVKTIGKQLLTALSKIHDHGYIHTDIKPENILVVGMSIDNEQLLEQLISPEFEVKISLMRQQLLRAGIVNIKKLYAMAVKKVVKDIVDRLETENKSSKSSESEECDCKKCKNDHNKYKRKLIAIDNKYLNDITIKIADLGTSIRVNNPDKYPSQTKYYKAPEIILELEYNKTIDMWSVGCMLFELITGDILFDPPRVKNKDIKHLCIIQEKLGIIYTDMYKQSYVLLSEEYNKEFNKINFKTLESYIIHYKDQFTAQKYNILDFIDFIQKCLDYNINNRMTSCHALLHNWISL